MKLLATLLLLSIAAPTTTATSATRFPCRLSVGNTCNATSILITVPSNAHPINFANHVRSDCAATKSLLIVISNQITTSIPTGENNNFRVQLGPTSIRSNRLTINLQTSLRPSHGYFQSSLTITDIISPRIRLSHSPRPTSAVTKFLTPNSTSFIITMPTTPAPTRRATNLSITLTLQRVTRPDATVSLRIASSPPPAATRHHAIIIGRIPTRGGDLSVASNQLIVDNNSRTLASTTASITSPGASLLSITRIRKLPKCLSRGPVATTNDLARLNVSSLDIHKVNQMSRIIAVTRTTFKTPISRFVIGLINTTAPILPNRRKHIGIH